MDQRVYQVKATRLPVPFLVEETVNGSCFVISKNNLSADFNVFSIFKLALVVKKTFPEIYST